MANRSRERLAVDDQRRPHVDRPHARAPAQIATWSMSSSAWIPVRCPGPRFSPMKSSTLRLAERVIAAAERGPRPGRDCRERLEARAVEVGARLGTDQARLRVDLAHERVGMRIVGQPQACDPLGDLVSAGRPVADGQVALDDAEGLAFEVCVARVGAQRDCSVPDRDDRRISAPAAPSSCTRASGYSRSAPLTASTAPFAAGRSLTHAGAGPASAARPVASVSVTFAPAAATAVTATASPVPTLTLKPGGVVVSRPVAGETVIESRRGGVGGRRGWDGRAAVLEARATVVRRLTGGAER